MRARPAVPRRAVLAAATVASLVFASAPAPAAGKGPEAGPAARYADVLDLHGSPAQALPPEFNDVNVFSDRGAWHAYALPREGDHAAYGGFTGPLYIAQEYPWWLSRGLTRMRLHDARSGAQLSLGADPHPVLVSLPGRLHQGYLVGDLRVRLDLRFVSDRTALVRATVANRGSETRHLNVRWGGSLLRPADSPMREAPELAAAPDGVRVDFARVRETWDYLTGGQERFWVQHGEPTRTVVDGDRYVTERRRPLVVPAGATRKLSWTETYTFTPAERRGEERRVRAVLARPAAAAGAVDARWGRLVARVTNPRPPEYRRTAVKALETLVTNWRSPAGQLRSDGITPSISYKWFAGGFWSWDSWKEAAAVAAFDPALAESTIRSVFDHQITTRSRTRPQDAGMVPDVVFYNDPAMGGGNWNERNSKPPLAAWATWEVFRRSGDRAFLREMYPKLAAFHAWWFRNRDHDRDGVCEYGATVDPANSSPEERRLAAAWESGMDNAPRFDPELGAQVVPNRRPDGRVVGYSLRQESVDLNAYLVADGRYLARIARALHRPSEAAGYERQAHRITRFVRSRMFDPQHGWFYDVDIRDGRPLTERGVGIEGAIPLWTGVAAARQARAVRDRLLQPQQFASFVPFPTVSLSSPYFSPTRYWRGPVWLDQATFAAEGLARYGYRRDARRQARALLDHAAGLLGQAPISENYNPLTGERLNAPNFSWSASMVLLLTGPAGAAR